MPYFQPRISKSLAVATLILGVAAQGYAFATEQTAADEQELYEYLFPEAGKSARQAPTPERVSEHTEPVAAEAPTMQSAWGRQQPKAWSPDQKQAMIEAFKPKPAPEQPPKLLAVDTDKAVRYAPAKLDSQPFTNWIDVYSKKQDLNPLLVQAMIKQESRFDPNIVSPKGASGLMQLMPGTAAEYNVDPFDPEQNINGGTQYFAMLLSKYKRVDYALAAYNAGPGAVDKYGGIPPYPETQNYVSTILADLANLEAKN
ncbi:transglycosylase SLT domain-containing protein [Pseudomonas syringae]|uniref:transglycosylase SLT domain-containing protein n=1 Tax=Pseudomonas syringae TaxID=317 RepID=UPI00046427DF